MRFRFVGAANGHVTGSCIHFSYPRTGMQFLVDCGLVQGEGNDAAENARAFTFEPAEIDFVLLTHAHQDHCGLLPKLYRDGFTGRVICTKATARLATISLMDSVGHANGLYSQEDVRRVKFECIDEREGFGLSRMLPISDDLFASFSRSAHVLGSTSICLGWLTGAGEKAYLVLSGDLGSNTKENPFQPLLAGRQGIFGYPEAIIVESTYGGRVRDDAMSSFDGRIAAWRQVIQQEVFDNKSLLVIPAFSLQRTQELLLDLYLVLKGHFLEEDAIQAPYHVLNPWYDEFENGAWSHLVQNALKRVIASLTDEEQEQWQHAVVKVADKGAANFTLAEDATVSLCDVKKLLGLRHRYPLDVVLDSQLAREMTSVFRDELCRRQRKVPSETVYRNRKMAERLAVPDEDGVDSVLKALFPPSGKDTVTIPLEPHTIQYGAGVSTPRMSHLQERGCILLTGGGMCEGGPVVKHLGKILSAKRQAVVLATGYMTKGSIGDTVLSICRAREAGEPLPAEKLKVGDEIISPEDITARVVHFQGYYSGHADQAGLMDFVFRVVGADKVPMPPKPAVVFLNHGQHSARNVLKEAIESRARESNHGDRVIERVELPDGRGWWYDLETKCWAEPDAETKSDALLRDILAEQRKTNVLLQQFVERLSLGTRNRTQRNAKGN